MSEGAEEMIEEIRRLALLIPGQMGLDVGDELGKGIGQRGHGTDDRQSGWLGKGKSGENWSGLEALGTE
jgi:hypothetical protein